MATLEIDNKVQNVINALYEDAKSDRFKIAKGLSKSIIRPMKPTDMEEVYLPISQEQGAFFYDLITNNNFKSIVEFGTSFGISALFLGAAARQTGGSVITTELLKSKANIANQNFKNAGLHDIIELRLGDALETLHDLNEPIDLLVLDGWKDLYLPLFKQLEPLFKKGTIIYSDNVDMADSRSLLEYIKGKSLKYDSEKIHNGKAEITVQVS